MKKLFLPALLALWAASRPAAEPSSAAALLKEALTAHQEGRLTEALRYSALALEADPRNATAKNYVWNITQALKKRRSRDLLRPGEKERAGDMARRHLEERRRTAEETLEQLRIAARQSRDLRSPTGLFTALSGLDQGLGPDFPSTLSDARVGVHMEAILNNLDAGLKKGVFVSRKDALRAEGYLAYYRRDWEAAVRLWESALREDPADAQVQSDLASLQTLVRRERQKKELEQLSAQGEAYQQTGLYREALESWQTVLERDPKYPGAKEGLAAAEEAIRKLKHEARLRRRMREAADLYKQEKYAAAADQWLEVLKIDPAYEKARLWLKLVGKRLEEAHSAAAVPPPAPRKKGASASASPKATEKASTLYKNGLIAYSQRDLTGAIRLWKEALALDPGLKKAQEAIRQGESELQLSTQ